jgi:hypothetical protein
VPIDRVPRFADIVDQLADRTNVTHATSDNPYLVQDFMDALARRFTELPGASYESLVAASMLGVGNDNFKPREFGSTGFNMAYFKRTSSHRADIYQTTKFATQWAD